MKLVRNYAKKLTISDVIVILKALYGDRFKICPQFYKEVMAC